jgi:hypothetical protein
MNSRKHNSKLFSNCFSENTNKVAYCQYDVKADTAASIWLVCSGCSHPADGDGRFARNVGKLLPGYKASCRWFRENFTGHSLDWISVSPNLAVLVSLNHLKPERERERLAGEGGIASPSTWDVSFVH